MSIFNIKFANQSVSISYDSNEAHAFLDFLFSSVKDRNNLNREPILSIFSKNQPQITLTEKDVDEAIYEGCLGSDLAAILYDKVIFHLLNTNSSGIALHAGAVEIDGNIAIIPGKSGAGKSSLIAWLVAHGFSYLTDELIFIPLSNRETLLPLTRPISLKGKAIEVMKRFYGYDENTIYEDERGCLLAGEFLENCSEFHEAVEHKPKIILFPRFSILSPIHTTRLSPAQSCGRLMECAANIRNLQEHGFRYIMALCRSLPSYQIQYGCLEDLNDSLGEIIAALCRKNN